MYRNKKDVDKHVESLLSKLSVKEFKTRAQSVARLYFDVGDYVNCQKYVEQYLTQKDNNAAAYKLLGQALQKLGQKEEALEKYKTSLDIDPNQTTTVLDICELLADEDVTIDPGRAKFWCEKVEATFPKHPIAFRLRERLVKITNHDPEAIENLLTSELEVRPKDVVLHIRLLKHYLQVNKLKEAFEHSCNIEFNEGFFIDNYAWYEILVELLKNNIHNTNGWLYQLFLLTVRERICILSLAEIPVGLSKGLVESNDLLHMYDQAIEYVANAGPCDNFAEFHAGLLQHHQGQFAIHAATYLLKKAKKSQINWRDSMKLSAPLMLTAWHTTPLDPGVNWLRNAPKEQVNAVNRWYSEGTYRCSQAGHYLITNVQDKSQHFLDQISQCCSGTHWRDKLYEKIFPSRNHLIKIKTSHLASNAYTSPVLRLPRKQEIEAYDCEAQRYFGNSLHHFVWTILNYKNFAHFKCTLFNMLTPSITDCLKPLNKLDIEAFLYTAAFICKKQTPYDSSILNSDKPIVLPAYITDMLCSLPQQKWWDCAFKYSSNSLGTELTDIRVTLTRGMNVIRCIDNYGLDVEILCFLGRIFTERAKEALSTDEKYNMEERAYLYYSSAIPILEKLKSNLFIITPVKRLFEYTHKDLSTKDINTMLDESKLCVAKRYIKNSEYDKAIEILSNLNSPQAYFYLCEIYQNLAIEDNYMETHDSPESNSKYLTLLNKAKQYGYKARDRLKESEPSETHPLYIKIQGLLTDIEKYIDLIPKKSGTFFNDEDKNSSIEDDSINHLPIRSNSHIIRNLSSTPKTTSNVNFSNYRTATDAQILESTQINKKSFDKIEHEIKTFNEFMVQAKSWFDENNKLGNQIMNTIRTNIQNNTDQFKLLKISVDHVKDEIDKCRYECKDVGDLKKQITELKKEVNKLKKSSSGQTAEESELYNLDDNYRTNDPTSTFSAQIPFAPSQVLPPFHPRLVAPFPVPPNPYQLYGQTLYNLYNQYSQTTSASGTTPMFDPTRTQINYPTVYPTPEQLYIDMGHFASSNVSTAPTVPNMPTAMSVPSMPAVTAVSNVPIASKMPVMSVSSSASVISSKINTKDNKEKSHSLPVNVVITTSDPLPTSTVTPAPVLSVTIPSKHIKGTPHNYQIPMPSTNETKAVGPPIFNFPYLGDKTNPTTTNTGSSLSWQAPSMQTFKPHQSNTETSSLFHNSTLNETLNNSKSVVDDICTQKSPNTSVNKSRTISEKSNTSVENYDPCPDFKPIVPLPAEIKVQTGEEDENVIFCARAKLFRFVDKQWKERGLGEMKLLKHKENSKVRVLMRREQIHKVCANHIISSEMEIKPMMNETKAYFWFAHDFADGNVVLEKFCIRFKTADIAQEFYKTFEKARLDSLANSNNNKESIVTNIQNTESKNSNTHAIKKAAETASAPEGKAIVGGFVFSSTPNFKPVTDNNESDSTQPSEQVINKTNIFGELTLKTNLNTPFGKLFSATSPQVSIPNSTAGKQVPNKLNLSDTVEEFEPSVDFKPVVPLPALVEQKTGEEDEYILFEHRAKLLRHDSNVKEWKERGLGNIKILVNKENAHKVRLLMRREQIMKVCCNHAVTKEMIFQKMPNVDKAVTWCAKDFSEGELVAETFCLRFKTAQMCDDFMDAIKSAQSKLKDESKAAKEEQNAAKQSIHSVTEKTTTGWGDNFKPKPGSWECQNCLVRNDADKEKCSACCNPRETTLSNPVTNLVPSRGAFKFSFGMPSQTTSKLEQKNELPIPATSTWGDKFKPKEGTWECNCCFVRNESNLENCSACNSAKDPNTIKTESKSIFDNVSTGKFHFGFPPITTNQTNLSAKISTSSIFDGTGAHKFNFGIPTNVADRQPSDSINDPISMQTKNSSTSEGPLNFSFKNVNESKIASQNKAPLLPTPHTDDTIKQSGVKESELFGFVFKPKTTEKNMFETSSKESGDASKSNLCLKEGDLKTSVAAKNEPECSEDNGRSVYSQRAKLFRFVDGEWKERGVGLVNIVKGVDNEELRVVMRNEQTAKVCLKHTLTPEIIYTPKDDQTWLFTAYDLSEGEASLQQFSLNFNNKGITLQFKEAIEKARAGKFHVDSDISKNDIKDETVDNTSEDVIFVSEIHATEEEQEKAKELMLPENFFTYRNKTPCEGCRGCENDTESVVPTRVSTTESLTLYLSPTLETSNISTPNNSIYGTPSNNEKKSDTSIFRTPIESASSSAISATPFLAKLVNATDESNIFNKENASNKNTNTLDQSIQQETPFKAQTGSASTLASGDSQQSKGAKTVLAPPKLRNTAAIAEAQTIKPTQSNPGFGDSKSIFGNKSFEISTNTSIFNVSADKGKVKQNEEVKSIFGGDSQLSTNLFSRTNQSNLFGSIASGNTNKPTTGIFGLISQNTMFGNISDQKSVFGNAFIENSNALNTELGSSNLKSDLGSGINKKAGVNESKPEMFLGFDGNVSFADLSSNDDNPTFQRKPDFQWEGAGQKLFNASKGSNKPKDDTETGDEPADAGTKDEEYDPHYEPIVPLPEKIIVTTGEENEQKLFGERCKLYRYDEKTREWKERGVGEMKILYHPEKNTYRMLLRREQVYKAVLNMLLFIDLEMLPMMKSDRAWTWAGINYAENPSGAQETLAVRFKSTVLANSFHETVIGSVKKLQAAAAKSIAENKIAQEKPIETVAPLRLPKHLEDTARADSVLTAATEIVTQPVVVGVEAQATISKTDTKPNGDMNVTPAVDMFKQVQFREPEQEEEHDYDDYEYDHDEYDPYYNEEEEEEDESSAYYSCDGEAEIVQGETVTKCEHARIMVTFDQDIYSPKILVADSATGEILTDMLIHTDTEFQLSGDSCTWSGRDFTSNDPVDKTVKVNFFDSETAMHFYDSCETSKAATYSSTDPES